MNEKCRAGLHATASQGRARALVVLTEMVATDSSQSVSKAARLNSGRAGMTALAAIVAQYVLVIAFVRSTCHPEADTPDC